MITQPLESSELQMPLRASHTLGSKDRLSGEGGNIIMSSFIMYCVTIQQQRKKNHILYHKETVGLPPQTLRRQT